MTRTRVFIRQPFTESKAKEQVMIQGGMDLIKNFQQEFNLDILTPLEAQSSESFKDHFVKDQAKEFTPENFRKYRFSLIDQSDAFVFLKTGLSESGSFEVAYNIFSGRKSPIFFAVWKQTPIKTTLLRDLESLCDVTYFEFDKPKDLQKPLKEFFINLNKEEI